MMQSAPNYMFEASEKPSLGLFDVPLIAASDCSVKEYGCLVDDPGGIEIEIVRWPAAGWRPIDDGTGDEGGYVEGIFHGEWKGDILYGANDAVNGNYVLGWSVDPQSACAERQTVPRDQVLLWHMNYHPDGGQLFFPLDKTPFVVPLALPGDDLSPEKIVAFWCDGTRGFIFIPMFGTREFSRLVTGRGFLTGRAGCMPVSAATSVRNSGCIYRCH